MDKEVWINGRVDEWGRVVGWDGGWVEGWMDVDEWI